MSVSATTAAKRRRAGNIVSSQLFKPTSAPIENSIQRRTASQQNIQQPIQSSAQSTPTMQRQQPINVEQTNPQKPMSLQQVISVFDKRLLHIESIIAKEQQIISGNAVPVEQPSINNEQVQEMIQHYLNPHISEFDHRYQMLATEIANLKQIVLKLQAYTLDVNKSLIEERIQILSDMKANVVIQPEDSLQLKDDLKELEDSVQEEEISEENQENITFSINNNSDIKEELIQEASSTEIIEEVVQESGKEVILETVETEEENKEIVQESGEDVVLETVETEEIVQEESQEVITEKLEQLVQSTEENIEQTEKEQLNDDLTQLSESITQIAEEKVEEPTKSKRKRKNKKSVAVNI